MVVAILATLAIAGTAFVMVMGQESKAASSALHLSQAELAARSGLEHAVAVIDKSLANVSASTWLVVTPDGVLKSDGTFTSTEATMDGGWHRYFESGTADQIADWVSHYNGNEVYGASATLSHEMRGRKIDLKWINPVPPNVEIKRGEYAVCVADLDGKLHANIARWTNDVGGDGSGSMVDQPALVGAVAGPKCANLAVEEIARLVAWSDAGDPEYASISEIARRAQILEIPPDGTAPFGKYALERFFTTYPVASRAEPTEFTASACSYAAPYTTITISPDWTLAEADAIGLVVRFDSTGACFRIVAKASNTEIKVSGDCSSLVGEDFHVLCPRPAVNVNTAPWALLAEILKPIPSFAADSDGDDKAEALAYLICQRRPFASRHELEDLVFRVAGNQDGGGFMEAYPLNGAVEELKDSTGTPVPNLTERQFNDCLNSIAGVIADGDSAFDEPTNPGVYSFDGWEPYEDTIGPSQTLGDCSAWNGVDSSLTFEPVKNVTWSTELKFHSRFFHVYVIGRGWNEKAGKTAGVKRLHAIYDSRPPAKIVWLRWNLSSRGSLTDM